MDRTFITITIIFFAILISVSFVVALFFILRQLGQQQEAWEEQDLGRRPRPMPNGNSSKVLWEFEKVINDQDHGNDPERRVRKEADQLELAGYQSRLVKLEERIYCVTVSGSLPTKNRTANVYLECGERFPDIPPNIYAEVLSATRFDKYGQAATREVELGPLQSLVVWNAQSSLLELVREVFGQLDESYHPTGQLSGFFDKYGDWVRPAPN